MQTAHVIETNETSASYAAFLRKVIKTRQDELAALQKTLFMVEHVAAGEQDPLPTFINEDDPGFQKVAAAADAARVNGRPVVPTQAAA